MMKHVRKIKPPPWMKLPETRAVMKALNGKGGEPAALFVGGCVRDALLGTADEDTDIDIATLLTPEEVTRRLVASGIKVVPTGIGHGTVTGVSGIRTFEITTLRRDVETDGRHAVVGFTRDWKEDAGRRDFTMNTLLTDMEGRVFDPLGTGLADLEAGRVVFVGDPETRIAEDYLRILRFFRFRAHYGRGSPEPSAIAACRRAAPRIATLSGERITKEFLGIVNAENPLPVLEEMTEAGVLDAIIPVEYPAEVLGRLCRFQERYNFMSVAARLLVLINLDADRNLPALESSLVLSGALRKEIILLEGIVREVKSGAAKSDKELIYRYGKLIAAQAVLLSHADGSVSGEPDESMELLRKWKPPELPVNGDDVIEAGIKSGPEVGAILSRIERWWIDNDFTPDRKECLERI